VTRQPATGEHAGKLTNDGVGGLTIARTRVTRTAYRVSNDNAQGVRVVVRHPKVEGAHLVAPADTEEGIGGKSALIPATVAAHSSTELVVEDEAPESGPVDWFSPNANAAVRAYLADPHADPVVAKKLEAVWSIRNDIVKLMEERDSLRV
jgi:hypothetical protein